jgi:signal transduction histidine kinase
VFFNLLLNACEAMPDRAGRVIIELADAPGGVDIRFSDNGRGIPATIRATLFEPFVSQGKENGTGLGLTVVQKIVQDHGGDVAVESTSLGGTVFRIAIPYPTATMRTAPADVDAPAPGAHANSVPQS